MVREPRNVAASVRARLQNLAREQQANFQRVLTRYALERLLFRLSVSRQVLLGNLWITTLGNSEVLIAALTEASIAAPIVSNDQRSRRDGALDEPTERLGATVEHDGEPNASGIASVFPVVELGARLSMTHLDGTGDGNLVVNTTAFPTRSPANPGFVHLNMVLGLSTDPVLVGPHHARAELVENLKGRLVARKTAVSRKWWKFEDGVISG